MSNEIDAKKQRMQERTLVITFNEVAENEIVVDPGIPTWYYSPLDGKIGKVGCKINNNVITEQNVVSCTCPASLVSHCMLLKNIDACFGDADENVKLVDDENADRKELMKKEDEFYRVPIKSVCAPIGTFSVDLLIGHVSQGSRIFDSCTLSADAVFATIIVADALQYDNLTQFIDDAVAYIARQPTKNNADAEPFDKYVGILSKANDENWKVETDAINALNMFADPIVNMQKLATAANNH